MIVVPYGKSLAVFEIRPEMKFRGEITDLLVIKEIFKENVYQVDGKFGDSGIVLDLGAHIGIFSIFCVLNGAKKVYAFEPDKGNFAILKENIKLNGMQDKIIPINKAVYNKKGKGKIMPYCRDSQLSSISGVKEQSPIIKERGKVEPIEVDMVRLEDILVDNKIDEVDVVKFDVEYSEYGIFKSTDVNLFRRFRYITMEFHSTDEENFGILTSTLSENFNTHIVGSYRRGGMIYATRY